jgi:hypothetical protein
VVLTTRAAVLGWAGIGHVKKPVTSGHSTRGLPPMRPLADHRITLPSLNETVELLVGEWEESFKYERAIRLFEFQTWIYWPHDDRATNTAGMMAAVFILEHIEEDIYWDVQAADPDHIGFVNLRDKPDATLQRINVLSVRLKTCGVVGIICVSKEAV